MTTSYREAAEHALGAWRTGALTGDWRVLQSLLADDATVQLPLGSPNNGPKIGAIEIGYLFNAVADTVKVRLDQHLIGALLHDGDKRFACELLGTGTVAGQPAQIPICLWFTLDDQGRVSAMREYIGSPPQPTSVENA